ncbi:MAG: HAMP domain-containing sensor histidine kinase [Solirubrobacteraceae bacterium]
MASPGSYIRSAARATYSAYRRLPIRWRLAGGSAALTFVILAGFAALVGTLTGRQVRVEFDEQQSKAIGQLSAELNGKLRFRGVYLDWRRVQVHLTDFTGLNRAQIRIFDSTDGFPLGNQSKIRGARAPLQESLFTTMPSQTSGYFDSDGYRVAVRSLSVKPSGTVILLYAVPLSDLDHTISRVDFFLLMRTRDPSKRLPHPEAEDEIAELARTLEGMLGALDAARNDTQSMLDRQREFVADASHELRTPLTSVLANLELLTEELGGEQAETAEAALRSTRRMRRLVGDLLLLARADARRVQPHRPTDLGDVLVEAASELGPVAESHELSISAQPVIVQGVRDELHRLVLNLLENAVRHTPPGTRIDASTRSQDGEAVLIVEDSGPGIPPELAHRVFERFVRGGRDGGRGSGLGLAIVRSVAQSHGGTVRLAPTLSGAGTRFEIRIPASGSIAPAPAAAPPAQTSTTTGRTIGRRRNRS